MWRERRRVERPRNATRLGAGLEEGWDHATRVEHTPPGSALEMEVDDAGCKESVGPDFVPEFRWEAGEATELRR